MPFLRSAEAELRRPEAGVTLGNPGTGGAVGRRPGRAELCGEARRGQRRPPDAETACFPAESWDGPSRSCLLRRNAGPRGRVRTRCLAGDGEGKAATVERKAGFLSLCRSCFRKRDSPSCSPLPPPAPWSA